MVNRLKRLDSSIPGLDSVLCGGFIAGASYILQGRPGAGKTIMANQIAFAQAKQGRGVLYVTLLAESHERLFEALSTMEYYDAAQVGSAMTYISVFQTLRAEGLNAVVNLLRREMGRQNPAMLVVDGLLNARDKADAAIDVKTFVAELQAHAAFSRCTVLLLTSALPGEGSPEHTMVDGVLELYEETTGSRTTRRLQVTKSRGSAALRGFHNYEITDQGIVVHPRLEVFLAKPSADDEPSDDRIGTGIAGFDPLIGDGFPAQSFTLVVGPSGSGKTTFGLSYLTLATPQEPAVMLSFYESPGRLTRKAKAIGIDLQGLMDTGALTLIWQPLSENLVDKLAYQLLNAVRATGARRVFIDGLGGFERAATDPTRLIEFFSVLSNELRALGTTTVASWESRNIFGLQTTSPSPEISGIVDNLLLLRQVQCKAALERVLAILKIRDGTYDAALYKVSIAAGGLVIDGRLEDAGGIAAGVETLSGPECV